MSPGSSAPSEQVPEYDVLRSGKGYVVLEGWSSLTLEGRDRTQFLNNFCTNDIRQLNRGDSCEAFFTDVKGRTIGHGLVLCHQEALVVITVPGLAKSLIEHLDRYLIREDVELRDTSSRQRLVLATGNMKSWPTEWPPFRCDWLQPTTAYVVAFPAEENIGDRLSDRAATWTHCPHAAFEKARIEAGFPLYGTDFDQANLPQEIGRDALAISFTKGCYLGQETVARLDALGHVNKRLVGVQFAGDEQPRTGVTLLVKGQPAGQITSVAHSPQLRAYVGLGIVRREHAEPGSELAANGDIARVLSLPLPVASST